VSEPEEKAQEQLREIVRELEAVQYRLLGVQAIVPPGILELVPIIEDEEMDLRTQLRAAVQNTLSELIEPAIRALRAAADLREEQSEHGR
jgi:hypothetical protein